MAKASLFVRSSDSVVKLACYGIYCCRSMCRPEDYPAIISYFVPCNNAECSAADGGADWPDALELTISGVDPGSCTEPFIYAPIRSELTPYCIELESTASGTVANPDCLPSGWTLAEGVAADDPGILSILPTAETTISINTPWLVGWFWRYILGEYTAEYVTKFWTEDDLSGDACFPGSPPFDSRAGSVTWRGEVNVSTSVYSQKFNLGFGQGTTFTLETSNSDDIPITLTLVCNDDDTVSVSAATGRIDINNSDAGWLIADWLGSEEIWLEGVGNDMAMDAYCVPTGECVIPLYFYAFSVPCVDGGGVFTANCEDVTCDTIATNAVLVGEIAITFSRVDPP